MTGQPSLLELSKMIDHSLLHPTMTDAEISAGCHLALKYDVATVCVKPYAIELAKTILDGSNVGICAVIAFPHGNSTSPIKIAEAKEAIASGATEIDMPINIGKAKGGDWEYVAKEIEAVNLEVVKEGAILKVIFENDYLSDEEIIRLCQICSNSQVAYIKTSSGYGFVKQENGMYSYKGATDEHLRLMRKNCPESVKVKAAGGVRTLDDLLRVRQLGVSRIGATATESILQEAEKRGFK